MSDDDEQTVGEPDQKRQRVEKKKKPYCPKLTRREYAQLQGMAEEYMQNCRRTWDDLFPIADNTEQQPGVFFFAPPDPPDFQSEDIWEYESSGGESD